MIQMSHVKRMCSPNIDLLCMLDAQHGGTKATLIKRYINGSILVFCLEFEGNSVALWQCGILAVWLCGIVAEWQYGSMAVWQRGRVAEWQCRGVAEWQCRGVAEWQCTPVYATESSVPVLLSELS